MTDQNPKQEFWRHSSPKTVSSNTPELVLRNADIEKMIAYDVNENRSGRPKENQHYSKIEKYSGGKLSQIIKGAYIEQSESREPYEYNVYSCAQHMFRHRHKSAVLQLV